MRAVGGARGAKDDAERVELLLRDADPELRDLVIAMRARESELEKELGALRRSKEELERSRNEYAFLYDFAPVGYFTLDRESAIKTANRTGANLLGMQKSLLLDCRFELFVAQEDRPLFNDFLPQVFASGTKETCRLRLASRKDRPLVVRIEAKATESGEWCHAVLVDITERRRAEEALKESEYNLAKAQSMTHVGSWRYNHATGELTVSDELLRILGLGREEVTPEAFGSVVHPEDFPSVVDHLQMGAGGTSYEIEHRLLLRDGTCKWVYTIVEPAVNGSGNVSLLYGTTQDITYRKKAEVELRSQKNELQAIFDSVDQGVIVFDADGKIQNLNHICLQLFPQGVEPGKSCQDLFHVEVASSPQHCPVERALRGERVEISLGSVREGDKIRYLDITATPIEDPLEKNRALVAFRDVTDKRLQELQLIQNEKMSSIGVLATGVAHEINNPLTSVAGYAEALLRRFRDERSLETDPRLEVFPKYLDVIIREAYHCKSIIDSLLNFGRKSDGFVCGVDLNGVIAEILELLRHLTSEAHVTVVTNFQPGLPLVNGDPSGLRQVFMNLLTNAHQAITGGGIVEVTTAHCPDEKVVTVQVRDTGCGIPPDVIDRIWDPFFTTKEAGKGIGLGLALTFSIVKRHGGGIQLESRVGEGSLFTVRLPVGGVCPDSPTSL